MDYQTIVEQFVYTELPSVQVSDCAKFEALVSAIFGTKQRRYGPLPVPEVQVLIRDVIRRSDDTIRFLVPWGASKQHPDAKIDVLELMAVRQLQCLAEDLARFGKRAQFTFRVEDFTDRILFGDTRQEQISNYSYGMAQLVDHILPSAIMLFESTLMRWADFSAAVEHCAPQFYEYFTGKTTSVPVGWKGTMPPEQVAYYMQAYAKFYPSQDHLMILSRYFAASMIRGEHNGTGKPNGPHLQICFSKPVPGNPFASNRLYFRTLPERMTHQHHAPWLADGFLQIDDATNECEARYWEGEKLQCNFVKVGGVKVACPFFVK